MAIVIELWTDPLGVTLEGIELYEVLHALVPNVPGLQNEDDLKKLEEFLLVQIRMGLASPDDVTSSLDRDDARHVIRFGVNEAQYNYLKTSGHFVRIVKAVPRHFVSSG